MYIGFVCPIVPFAYIHLHIGPSWINVFEWASSRQAGVQKGVKANEPRNKIESLPFSWAGGTWVWLFLGCGNLMRGVGKDALESGWQQEPAEHQRSDSAVNKVSVWPSCLLSSYALDTSWHSATEKSSNSILGWASKCRRQSANHDSLRNTFTALFRNTAALSTVTPSICVTYPVVLRENAL